LKTETREEIMARFKPRQVVVISLWADDLPAAVHFYRDVVGLDLVPHHGRQPAFDLGDGSHLVIVQGQPIPARNAQPSRFPLIAFAVPDLDRAVEHLKAHGVGLPWGIETGNDARWVMFQDPAGNLIEFAQINRKTYH
jgi:catechol 2,3-dioxygenase-like lactoylglutathione lyase family enzyme